MSDNGLLQNLLRTRGYRITHTEMNLHGPERFAAEGMATQEQCDSLINMANVSLCLLCLSSALIWMCNLTMKLTWEILNIITEKRLTLN
jgi:hypothetical protein